MHSILLETISPKQEQPFRFCLDCAASNLNAFPDEMQSKIAKKLEAEAKEKEKESGGGVKKEGGKKAKH